MPDLFARTPAASPASLSATVRAIQDIMRKDDGLDGDAQRLSQLGWMLFLKLFDDKEAEVEASSPAYRSPIPEPLRWRSWGAPPDGPTGEALLAFVNTTLFPALKDLPTDGQDPRAFTVRAAFEDAHNYMKNGTLLRQVANRLGAIDFTADAERHLFNDVYESLLRDLQSAGNAGEYYTPRAVTRFMTERVDPRLGETVLDPACGTGGFLVDVIEHLRRGGVSSIEQYEQLQRTIRGVEKKPLPHLLALTNLLLHDLERPDIRRGNTLARPLVSYGPADRVDVVLSNPPFGGVEEDGIEQNFPDHLRTRETADLFLALILRLLRPGGRAAVVLPDGFLFGEGVKTRLKQQLVTECRLHTIVRLPNGVFAPYTDITTNLLFFDKVDNTSTALSTQHVWYYALPLPDGYKKYTKNKPIRFDDFDGVAAWWNDRRETEHAWRVPVQTLLERGLNLDLQHPERAATTDTRTSDDLLASLHAHSQTLDALVSDLRRLLADVR